MVTMNFVLTIRMGSFLKTVLNGQGLHCPKGFSLIRLWGQEETFSFRFLGGFGVCGAGFLESPA